MKLTKPIAIEENTATSTGTATSITSATCVRLFNSQGSTVVVNISPEVGAAAVASFSMPTLTTELIQKLPTDVIYTSAAIKATKVSFTN
jgi:hypothetical protein